MCSIMHMPAQLQQHSVCITLHALVLCKNDQPNKITGCVESSCRDLHPYMAYTQPSYKACLQV